MSIHACAFGNMYICIWPASKKNVDFRRKERDKQPTTYWDEKIATG